MKNNKIKTGILGLIAIFLLLFFIFPVIWFLLTSFQTKAVSSSPGFHLFFKPTLENYQNVFSKLNFLVFFKNSLIIGIISTIIAVVISSLAAYSFSRYKSKFTYNLSFWILSNRMLPPIAIVAPLYLLMSKLSLLDTYPGIILAYCAANIPYAVWMLITFFQEIPYSLDEAGIIDGCSKLQVLSRIVIPLAKPGILATGIFIFVLSWSEFLVALMLTSTQTKTLPVAIAAFVNDRGIEWGNMAAAGTVVLFPLAVLFYSIQKHLIRGLTYGAVKG